MADQAPYNSSDKNTIDILKQIDPKLPYDYIIPDPKTVFIIMKFNPWMT